MIEDALKSSRALHRLIMTVSLVTVVFSFSLDLPLDKVAHKAAIDALIATDFLAYEEFVAGKVEQVTNKKLRPIKTQINKHLETAGHEVIGLDDIGDALGRPMHVGKILTKELALADISDATIVKLEALNGLQLGDDVQITIPRVDGLIPEINEFLSRNWKAGRRVDTIRVSFPNVDLAATSFLPESNVTAGLYFELLDAVFTGGAPTFNANYVADVHTIPESSFTYWLEHVAKLGGVVEVKDGLVVFAPALNEAPNGYREEKLGTLSLRLGDEIAKAGPENQSASILGAEIPGLLIVFASPLALLVLAYYFMNHTNHLRNLAEDHSVEFKTFAWLPLALRNYWRLGSGPVCIAAWRLETSTSTIFLPIVSLAALYLQLLQFGGLGFGPTAVIFAAGAGIIIFGLGSLFHIAEVRKRAKVADSASTSAR